MKKRSFSLQTHLLALLAVALLPILVVGAIAIVLGSQQLHQRALQQLQDNAVALADVVDQRFISYGQILRLKTAAQPQYSSAHVPPLHHPGSLAELVLVDLREPAQTAALPAAFLQQLPGSSAITVSDLFASNSSSASGSTNAFNIAIGLPAANASETPRYALLLPPSDIIDFSQSSLPDGPKDTLIALVDRQGRIVARSRNQAHWLGKTAPNWAQFQAISDQQGWLPVMTTEGNDFVAAFKRLEVAQDWVLVMAEDQQALNAAWRTPLQGMLLGLFVTTVVSLLLARWASQRILRPFKQVHSSSRAILGLEATEGPSPQLGPMRIREFEELSTNLIHAQSLLKDQTEQAQALTQQLQRNEARHRAMAEVGALVFWQADLEWRVLQLTGWRELTGQSSESALGHRWRSRIHPADLFNLEANLAKGAAVDTEFRVLDVHERWHWVRARGIRISDTLGGQPEWAGVLEDVDARLRAQARIGYLAKYDPLTGLANRNHFHDVLVAAITHADTRAVAVLSMDLDRFMHINDSLGHAMGDELLQRVTARFLALLPENGLLARFGGDEFSLLFKTDSPKTDIEQLSHKILAAFQEPFVIDEHSIIANTCIGAAWSQSPTDRAELIMRHAELALHRAKADLRKPMRFFDPSMEQQMLRQRQMEVDLRFGLENAQFYLVYQPLIELQTLDLVGFEALLRWQHPTLGVLTPGRFIHVAEELGLMDKLGAWVLAQACQDARGWPDDNLTVAVNIAASQLTAHLEERITQVLIATDLAPRRLELEVTENALMTHIEDAANGLLQLKAQGVSIVLDDFGTGYTSLSHLRAFPFSKVKIDKGFVHDLCTIGHEQDGEAIISAISLLCKRLGIVAVAEGVETQQQMDLILSYECQQAQGFLFGRPLTQAETCELITRWPEHKQRFQDL